VAAYNIRDHTPWSFFDSTYHHIQPCVFGSSRAYKPCSFHLLLHISAIRRAHSVRAELRIQYLHQSCKRASFEARNLHKPKIYFEARFKSKSQIYPVSQDMRNCVVLVDWWCRKLYMTKWSSFFIEGLTNAIASTVPGDKSVRRSEKILHVGPKHFDKLKAEPGPKHDLKIPSRHTTMADLRKRLVATTCM